MKSEMKIRITAVVVTVLFVLTLGVLAYTIKIDQNTSKSLRNEKLKSEGILSEKLTLEKQIVNFKNDLKGLQGKNAQLDAYLNDVKKTLTEKERAISKLVKENTAIAELKKENQEINALRNQLMEKVGQLGETNVALNSELENMNKRYSDLKKENSQILAQLNERNSNKLVDGTVGNFRIDPAKKNPEKFTIKARRTNAVIVSFDVPKGNPNNLNYSMYRMVLQRPEGGDINGTQKTTRIPNDSNLTASISKEIGALATGDRVNISFAPKDKLKEGIYTVIIYEGNERLGSAQIRLIK